MCCKAYTICHTYTFFLWLCSPARTMTSSFTRFLDHTQRRPTVGKAPLDERSARHRDLYLTTQTHTTDKHPYPGGIRNQDRSRRAAIDIRVRPHGHWDRHTYTYYLLMMSYNKVKTDSASCWFYIQICKII
jgi:hypothetical protein